MGSRFGSKVTSLGYMFDRNYQDHDGCVGEFDSVQILTQH